MPEPHPWGADRLPARIATQTGVAWVLGVALLAALCVGIANRSLDQDVDDRLRVHALAGYGLGWWDETGRFHDEDLRKEPELFGGDVRVTVATPAGAVFGPDAEGQAALVAEAMGTLNEVWVRRGSSRTLAIVTYDASDEPSGAVIASVSTTRVRRATLEFAAVILAGALGLCLAGLVFSRRLSARVLRAFQAQMAERERILAGAAHELRTPLATVLAVIDAAEPGQSAEALPQIRDRVAGASAMVERLLTWSRLTHTALVLEAVRLDLLVELCLAEDEPLDAQACVVRADPRLIEVAVRNLVENARVHGGGVRLVRVADGCIEVLDYGAGVLDDALLDPFCKGDASPGTGLGLALVQRIVEKHGGAFSVRPVVSVTLPS